MVTVVSNTITDHPQTGLLLNLQSGNAVGPEGITANVIRRNDVGVRVTGSQPPVLLLSGNDIYQNTSYELRNQSSITVVANGNFWGEPTGTELSQNRPNLSRIYDIRDGASQQVLINQWYGASVTGGEHHSPATKPIPQNLGNKHSEKAYASNLKQIGFTPSVKKSG